MSPCALIVEIYQLHFARRREKRGKGNRGRTSLNTTNRSFSSSITVQSCHLVKSASLYGKLRRWRREKRKVVMSSPPKSRTILREKGDRRRQYDQYLIAG